MSTTGNEKCDAVLTLLDFRGNKVTLECQQKKRHRAMHSNEFTNADESPMPNLSEQLVTLVFWGNGNKVRAYHIKAQDVEFHATNRYMDLD